jgi:hypothetical protein
VKTKISQDLSSKIPICSWLAIEEAVFNIQTWLLSHLCKGIQGVHDHEKGKSSLAVLNTVFCMLIRVHVGLFWLFHLQLDDFCAGVGVIKLIVCMLLKDKTLAIGSWRLVIIYCSVMFKTKDSFKSHYVQSSLYVHTDDCNWCGWLIFLGWPLQYP